MPITKIPASMQQRGFPPQFIAGLEVVRDPSVPTKRVVVSPGECRSKSDDADIILATAMMKRLDQTWAAGSGNGALDAGSLAADTWYHLHVMQNPSTGAGDILASGSLTNPALPSGWTAAPIRRFWSVRTDSSANIIPFTQIGNWCAWGVLTSQYEGNLGAAATVIPLRVPIGMRIEAQFLLLTNGAGAGEVGLMDPEAGDPTLNRFYTTMVKIGGQSAAFRGNVFTDINGRAVGWADANINSSVQTIGYWDRRDDT